MYTVSSKSIKMLVMQIISDFFPPVNAFVKCGSLGLAILLLLLLALFLLLANPYLMLVVLPGLLILLLLFFLVALLLRFHSVVLNIR